MIITRTDYRCGPCRLRWHFPKDGVPVEIMAGTPMSTQRPGSRACPDCFAEMPAFAVPVDATIDQLRGCRVEIVTLGGPFHARLLSGPYWREQQNASHLCVQVHREDLAGVGDLRLADVAEIRLL